MTIPQKQDHSKEWEATDKIAEAIKQLSKDAGALYAPDILDELKRIRDKDPAAWARLRQQVKEAKVLSMADLDRLTAPAYEGKESDSDGFFTEDDLWPEPVDGAVLLHDIVSVMGLYVIADKETIRAAALWVVFTWLLDVVQVAPIANITAPEKRCGKTVMLSTLGKLAYRPLQASDIATAALFRSIELWSPTLLIDEVDAFLRDNEEARGILNAGFTRDSAFVIRCVGDDHTPTKFGVWGAKALCGIGKIADTLTDRSIPLRLRRKKPGETTAHLRHSDESVWVQLRSRIARFADDNAPAIGASRPAIIEGLNDRANDAWEPLLAIADAAGGDWSKVARHAAVALHGIEGEAPSVGVELLTDIKEIFDNKHMSKIFSSQMLDDLVADDEAPWATWNRGKPMTARQLSMKLGEFGIKPKNIRIGSTSKKGYDLSDMTEVFASYLSGGTPFLSATPLQPTEHKGCSVDSSATSGASVADKKPLEATDYKGCSGVADRTPLPPEEDDGEDI